MKSSLNELIKKLPKEYASYLSRIKIKMKKKALLASKRTFQIRHTYSKMAFIDLLKHHILNVDNKNNIIYD